VPQVHEKDSEMKVSVVIPSYGRPDRLERCLAALAHQERKPDEIGVVARETDTSTLALLHAAVGGPLPLQVWQVRPPGVVAAQNLGLKRASGDIIAFLDDDTEPWPDWLARVHAHFAGDLQLGALGGRDYLYADGVLLTGRAPVVGRVQWMGRLVGNHHLGTGDPREVEHLKGANMCFRREAISGLRFDPRLKGGDAEWCQELAVVFCVRRRGWKVVYDPGVAVDHRHSAERMDRDRRDVLRRTYNHGYNETLALLDYLPPVRRVVYVAWAFLVGTAEVPGFAQWVRFLGRRRRDTSRRVLSAWRGRLDALRDAWPVMSAGLRSRCGE
jgi:GT2 family glycosyltransferase